MDSVLFEDDAELEYFDVLNLLPLSNIRLEYDRASSSRDDNCARNKERTHILRDLRALEYNEPCSANEETSPSRSGNATDEEKCKEHTAKENNPARIDDDPIQDFRQDLDSPKRTSSNRQGLAERKRREFDESSEEDSEINSANKFVDQRASSSSSSSPPSSKTGQDQQGSADVERFVNFCEVDRKIEEVEDYKSIWISGKSQEEMSRRPQILKVVDNDVTRRRHRRSVVEIDAIVGDVPRDKGPQEIAKKANERVDASVMKLNKTNNEDEIRGKSAQVSAE